MDVAIVAARMEGLGGMETVILRSARHLVAAGHRVTVVSAEFRAPVDELLRQAGVQLQALSLSREQLRLRGLAEVAAALGPLLEDADVIIPHNHPAWVWVHQVASHLVGKKVVACCHEPPRNIYEDVMDRRYLRAHPKARPWFTRVWDHWMLHGWRTRDQEAMRWMPAVLTNSKYTALKIQQIYEREATACYFGPPLPGEPAPAVERQPGDVLRVLWVGRMTPFKNPDVAVRAVAQARGTHPMRLRMVGDGEFRSDLENLARHLQCTEVVEFLGAVTEERLQQEYRDADVVVYVPFDEPMGLVPIEAALYRVPSVASNHGGPSEVVVNGQTGLLVDPKSPEEIADALQRLAGDAQLRTRLGEAARERVLSRMTFEHFAKALEDAITSSEPVGPT